MLTNLQIAIIEIKNDIAEMQYSNRFKDISGKLDYIVGEVEDIKDRLTMHVALLTSIILVGRYVELFLLVSSMLYLTYWFIDRIVVPYSISL